MLKAEGLVVNEKKTYRIYCEEKLQVRRKRRKRLLARNRVPMPIPIPERPNQRWSMDFVSDQLATGPSVPSAERCGRLQPGVHRPDRGHHDHRRTRQQLLDQIVLERSVPEAIVAHNGLEVTSKAMHLWSQRVGATLRFIQPGKPIQNALVESFNGKFRDACLNEHWFIDIADARRTIQGRRVHYNTVRPHSSLGFLTPEQFRRAVAGGCGKAVPSGTLENSSSFPLSHSLNRGDNSPNSSLWSRT